MVAGFRDCSPQRVTLLFTLTSSQQVCRVNSGPTHAGMCKVVPTEKPMRVHTSQPKGLKGM